MYHYHYPRPAVTTDAIVVAREDGIFKILLIRRQKDPFKGRWALPGGFINMDETLQDACRRELREETGIITSELRLLGIYDAIDRDPRGRTISAVYYTILPACLQPEAGDDAIHAGWIPLGKLPPLAFDHEKIIGDFLGLDCLK